MNNYTAGIIQSGDGWIGWVAEVPGVNCQEATRDELMNSLHDTLQEALVLNREDAHKAAYPYPVTQRSIPFSHARSAAIWGFRPAPRRDHVGNVTTGVITCSTVRNVYTACGSASLRLGKTVLK